MYYKETLEQIMENCRYIALILSKDISDMTKADIKNIKNFNIISLNIARKLDKGKI